MITVLGIPRGGVIVYKGSNQWFNGEKRYYVYRDGLYVQKIKIYSLSL
jgi:hypothetical protein